MRGTVVLFLQGQRALIGTLKEGKATLLPEVDGAKRGGARQQRQDGAARIERIGNLQEMEGRLLHRLT